MKIIKQSKVENTGKIRRKAVFKISRKKIKDKKLKNQEKWNQQQERF